MTDCKHGTEYRQHEGEWDDEGWCELCRAHDDGFEAGRLAADARLTFANERLVGLLATMLADYLRVDRITTTNLRPRFANVHSATAAFAYSDTLLALARSHNEVLVHGITRAIMSELGRVAVAQERA